MLDIDISRFIKQHQLPAQYQQLSQKWFSALAERIATHQNGAEKPLVIGINGAQGSGKSTLADLLKFILGTHFKCNTVSLSLDDFYYTRQERQTLAKEVHPLLMTRGVPGTHDVALACSTITALQSNQLPVNIPRFNKAIDDRVPTSEADQIAKPVDIILLEGWCMGSQAQDEEALFEAVNALEASEDADMVWRQYVNVQLAETYPTLFNLVDIWVMLKAPSFECIYQWRLEQENKLRAKATNQQHVMDDQQVARFIQFYQRITEHTLQSLPDKVHYLYELSDKREVTSVVKNDTPVAFVPKDKWLVFTDMDGSLLDHYTYQFDAASPTLEKLAQHNIPVIPITSKTEAELIFLREALDNQHPFIIENGAAVFIPKGYFNEQPNDTSTQGDYWVKAFVDSRDRWQALIAEVAFQYTGQFTTFTEAGIDGIMEMTSLDRDAASRAAQRQYGEPLAWLGDDEQKKSLVTALKGLGANVLEGGRFIHVSGESDKGLALQWLAQVYQTNSPDEAIKTVALGDSNNDKAMLEVSDHAVLIRSPVHEPPIINRDKQLFVSTHTGPEGWAEGVNHFIGDALQTD